jgi:hypothetical protein
MRKVRATRSVLHLMMCFPRFFGECRTRFILQGIRRSSVVAASYVVLVRGRSATGARPALAFQVGRRVRRGSPSVPGFLPGRSIVIQEFFNTCLAHCVHRGDWVPASRRLYQRFRPRSDTDRIEVTSRRSTRRTHSSDRTVLDPRGYGAKQFLPEPPRGSAECDMGVLVLGNPASPPRAHGLGEVSAVAAPAETDRRTFSRRSRSANGRLAVSSHMFRRNYFGLRFVTRAASEA